MVPVLFLAEPFSSPESEREKGMMGELSMSSKS
jgi:hypothetical protein